MPELPEVQSVVNTLAARVLGRRIVRATVSRADFVSPATFDLAAHLSGRNIRSITRRAKRIVFQLDDGNRFYVHLGMSGRLTVAAPGFEMAPHTHFILDLDDSLQIRLCDPRRFGGIFWLGARDHEESLGPEPLEISAGRLQAALGKTRRAIKTALLDQKLIAGLGNIYVDEALFEAGIHPLKRADGLNGAQTRRLHSAIKRVLLHAIRHNGSTLRDYVNADGTLGGFQKLHRVYGRGGLPCVRCGARLHRIILGARSTIFCAKCQRKRDRKTVSPNVSRPARSGSPECAAAAPRG